MQARYRSHAEPKQGAGNARTCSLCRLKGHSVKSPKCATGAAMGTKITMNRLAAELCGVPAVSLKSMGNKMVLPGGDVNGFSIVKVDPKTNSVYGAFSSGPRILSPGIYDFTELRKWSKGKHHHCFVKLDGITRILAQTFTKRQEKTKPRPKDQDRET